MFAFVVVQRIRYSEFRHSFLIEVAKAYTQLNLLTVIVVLILFRHSPAILREHSISSGRRYGSVVIVYSSVVRLL